MHEEADPSRDHDCDPPDDHEVRQEHRVQVPGVVAVPHLGQPCLLYLS